jgi:hypothetical protein
MVPWPHVSEKKELSESLHPAKAQPAAIAEVSLFSGNVAL